MAPRTVRRQLEVAAEEADDDDVKRHILSALDELDGGDQLGAEGSLGASGLGAN